MPLSAGGRRNDWDPIHVERIITSDMSVVYPALAWSAGSSMDALVDIPYFLVCGRFGIVSPLRLSHMDFGGAIPETRFAVSVPLPGRKSGRLEFR